MQGSALCLALVAAKTAWDIETPHLSTHSLSNDQRFQVLDRQGKPLGVSYQTQFNTMDVIPLHQVPDPLWHAFVTSEDRRFFDHHGVDWQARGSAIWQNVKAQSVVRGASTISEQVVRILHPRPRTLWWRWIEGFEAMLLERQVSKGDILAFYLNQVPYAANRRGIAQAAHYYFNRDVDTLTLKEMLALAVLPRAPSALDLYRNPGVIEPAIQRLASAMAERGELTKEQQVRLDTQMLVLEKPELPSNAMHFIQYIRESIPYRLSDNGMLLTTLDAGLQQRVQQLLDERIKGLSHKKVSNGAAIVVDHHNGEILAWAVAGSDDTNTPGYAIDAVRVPRQPGSSLKPFLYAQALDAGWSPATPLDDSPMAEAIGFGLHDFRNYSGRFHGIISLREALGNSLNIPALRAVQFVGPKNYLRTLHQLGITSLNQPAEFYKDGLALGIGEISLLEMVQAYAALANQGVFRPLTPIPQPMFERETRRVYSEEAASLIGNILSDPYARQREFGSGSVLNLPVQTAIKTGTSNDYRDAWVLGFNARYTIGIWLGNLDQTPMEKVTGSTGPALVMRSIFADLAAKERIGALYMSPKLVQKEVCANPEHQLEDSDCFPRTEYFIAGTESTIKAPTLQQQVLKLRRPTDGLQLAYDPRIPAESQAFEFVVNEIQDGHKLEWLLNGERVGMTDDARLLWPVARGRYTLQVREIGEADTVVASDKVQFRVK